MDPIDAYHLPGLGGEELLEWEIREYDGGRIQLRYPILSPPILERLLAQLRDARARYLAERPVDEIVSSIDRVASRLQERGYPARELAGTVLPVLTGYSAPMIELVLDRMTADWRAPALRALLEAELGDPGLLDGFRPRQSPGGSGGSRLERAFGPELAFHIFAGNVPGVAPTSLIRTLLVKSASFGKMASGEPLLAALFARTLAEVDPELGECLAVTYWPGGTRDLEDIALNASEVSIIYGGAEVVHSIRARAPAGTRLIEHGPRLSLAAIGREVLTDESAHEVAEGVALAVATFDQQGCVSPQMVYLERGGEVSPEEFARLVAEALDRLESELPRGELTAAEAAAIHQLRGAAEFRAIGGRVVEVYASEGTEYTVIYDDDPTFAPSPLNRLIQLAPISDLSELTRYLDPYRDYLQSVGIEADSARREELAEGLGRIGVSRVTTLAALPWPPPTWRHDGQEPLRELLRWTEVEG